MIIHLVCAARPNFMKIAPLYHALRNERWATPVIIHTGQHYDRNMFDTFFEELGLPTPEINLGVGSGSHAEQTGKVMISYEKVLQERRPDLVVVVGDVNSTMAATITATKMGIRVAHLEAGLRSFDRSMPEELNRLVTDVLADMHWTPSRDANENLHNEGVAEGKISLVGNIMIDSLEMLRNKIECQKAYGDFGLEAGSYGIVTLHRPSNVDDPQILREICGVLKQIAESVPLVFPIHPRTRQRIEDNNLQFAVGNEKKMFLPEPLNYVRFMNLVFNCRFVITDSGGIQEETTVLGVPCVTLRENTERPVTVTSGTNILVGADREKIVSEGKKRINGYRCEGSIPPLWDGHAAERIVETIMRLHS